VCAHSRLQGLPPSLLPSLRPFFAVSLNLRFSLPSALSLPRLPPPPPRAPGTFIIIDTFNAGAFGTAGSREIVPPEIQFCDFAQREREELIDLRQSRDNLVAADRSANPSSRLHSRGTIAAVSVISS